MTMQDRISSNTNLVAFSREGKRTMETLIPLYASSGYRVLDLNFCEMMNPSSILNTDKGWEYIEKLKEEKHKYEIDYIQAHAPYPRDYLSLSDTEKEKSNREILLSMDYAAALGIPQIVVHPIKGSIRENIGYFTSLLKRRKQPIRIAVENMETDSEIYSADSLLEIVKPLYPECSLCLDTGHAHMAGENIVSFIRKTQNYLTATHIADNNGKSDQHLLPGFGTICWEDVIKAFKDYYDGYLNYECMFFSRALPQSVSESVIELSLSIGEWLLSLAAEECTP